MSSFSRVVAGLLDILAPPGCAACDAPSRAPFCETCGALPAPPSAHRLDDVPLVVAGLYAPPLSTAITRFKYEGRPELARSLATLLRPALAQLPLPSDATLVPVPLHPRRLATRGYNQAALLARELGQSCGLGCEPRLLRRARETEHQVGKSRALRLTNARGAFQLRGSGPARVVLVDDVVTTGSTVRACAQALRAGGAELVAIVALARAVAD
jgi:ComF family protein